MYKPGVDLVDFADREAIPDSNSPYHAQIRQSVIDEAR
jgi:hypothetical protein